MQEQEIIWRFFYTGQDMYDISKTSGKTFESVLAILQPYIKEAQADRLIR